jgi:hypothetical protein
MLIFQYQFAYNFCLEYLFYPHCVAVFSLQCLVVNAMTNLRFPYLAIPVSVDFIYI